MYLPDLEPCRYRAPFHADQWHAPLLAIGWLEHPHKFNRGFAPHAVSAQLECFIENAQSHFEQYHSRGLHLCSLCDHQHRETKLIPFGFFTLLVPGIDVIYAAPAAILHYMKAHYYVPPDEFIEAINRCPPYGSDEFLSELKRVNGGIAPPIERYEDVVRAFQEALDATAKAREEAAAASARNEAADQGELLADVRKSEHLKQTELVALSGGHVRNSKSG